MKTKFLLLVGILGSALTAHGTLIGFNTFDANGTQTGYQLDGAGGQSAVVGGAAGNPTTYNFTLNSDLDGGGTLDTLTFDFVYTIYTGSTISGGDVTLGSSVALADLTNVHYGQNHVGDPSVNVLEPGNSFRLSIQNISYTNGENDPNAAIQFLGFQQLTKFGNGGGDLFLGTTGYSTLSVGAGSGSVVDFGGYVAGDLVLTTSIESGTTSQRLRDLHFDFETYQIPEASSLALLGVGALMLSVSRRRNGRQ